MKAEHNVTDPVGRHAKPLQASCRRAEHSARRSADLLLLFPGSAGQEVRWCGEESIPDAGGPSPLSCKSFGAKRLERINSPRQEYLIWQSPYKKWSLPVKSFATHLPQPKTLPQGNCFHYHDGPPTSPPHTGTHLDGKTKQPGKGRLLVVWTNSWSSLNSLETGSGI